MFYQNAYMCTLGVSGIHRGDENIGFYEPVVTVVWCEVGRRELNSSPLEKQEVIINTEPFLQP